MNVRNSGTGAATLTSYTIKDSSNAQYSNSVWSGPTIAAAAVVPVNLLIDGASFMLHWGGMYSAEIGTVNVRLTFWLGQLGVNMQFRWLNSPTNMTLSRTNTGPPAITLTAYYVKDLQGHWFNNTSWSLPTVAPGDNKRANVVIDGGAFTFQSGSNYTLYLVDSTNTEWTVYATP